MIYMNRTATCVPTCHSTHGFKQSELGNAKSLVAVLAVVNLSVSIVCVLLFMACECTGLKRQSEEKTQLTLGTNHHNMPTNKRFPTNEREPRGFISARVMLYCSLAFAINATLTLFNLFGKERVSCTAYNGHLVGVISCYAEIVLIRIFSCLLSALGCRSCHAHWLPLYCTSVRTQLGPGGSCCAIRDGNGMQ
jgi:hypothetical protein